MLSLLLLSQLVDPMPVGKDTLCPALPQQVSYRPIKPSSDTLGMVRYYMAKGYEFVGFHGRLYQNPVGGKGLACITSLTETLWKMMEDIEALQADSARVASLVGEMEAFYRDKATEALTFVLATWANRRGGFVHAYSVEGESWPVAGEEEGLGVVRKLASLAGLQVERDTIVYGGKAYSLNSPEGVYNFYTQWAFEHPAPDMAGAIENFTGVMGLAKALEYVREAAEVLKACAKKGCYPLRDGALEKAMELLEKARGLLEVGV